MICNFNCKHTDKTLVQITAEYCISQPVDDSDDLDVAAWALLREQAPILVYQCDMCGALLIGDETPAIEDLVGPIPEFDKKLYGYRLRNQVLDIKSTIPNAASQRAGQPGV